MNLTVISHACTTPVNQQFYAEIEKLTGWKISLLTPSSWTDGFGNHLIPSKLPSFRGKVLSLPVWKSGSIPLHAYRSFLLKFLRESNPNFIYVQQEPYAVATIQTYFANLLSVRKPISFLSWQNIYKDWPFPFSVAERWVLKNSACAFPGTSEIEAILRRKGLDAPCCQLPYGIDPTIYYPHKNGESLRKRIQLHPEEILIGYLGRIVPIKGLDTLLKALSELEDLPWRFVCGGAGSYQENLKVLAEKLSISNRISWLGYVSHDLAPQYLSAFDALILPSETQTGAKEQFGRVVIEAMACGTPVIGSDSGGIPELVLRNEGGFVFPEGDVEQLKLNLRKLISDSNLRLKLADQGRKSVLKYYSNSSIAQDFISMVDSIMSIDMVDSFESNCTSIR